MTATVAKIACNNTVQESTMEQILVSPFHWNLVLQRKYISNASTQETVRKTTFVGDAQDRIAFSAIRFEVPRILI